MIVDTDTDSATSLALFLEKELPRVRAFPVTTPEDALQVLEEREIELVIADYRLAAENGIEFLARVREARPNVKTILVTAYAEPSIFATAVGRARVDGLFVKPVDYMELARSVNRMFEGPERKDDPYPWKPVFRRRP